MSPEPPVISTSAIVPSGTTFSRPVKAVPAGFTVVGSTLVPLGGELLEPGGVTDVPLTVVPDVVDDAVVWLVVLVGVVSVVVLVGVVSVVVLVGVVSVVVLVGVVSVVVVSVSPGQPWLTVRTLFAPTPSTEADNVSRSKNPDVACQAPWPC